MATPSPTTVPDDARLAALRSFRVVEDMAEPGLERITRLTAASLGMPMAWISLIDEVWLLPQACFGGSLARMPRHGTPCERAMADEAVLVINHLRRDERFAAASLPDALRAMDFYAGAALVTAEGHRIGTLCVMDWSPNRTLSAAQRSALSGFAGLVVDQLERRRAEFGQATVAGLAEASEYAFLSIDADGTITFVNRAAESTFGYEPGSMLGRSVEIIIPEPFRKSHRASMARIAGGATPKLAGRTMELTAQRRDGTLFPIEFALSVWPTRLGPGFGAVIRDISRMRARDAALVQLAHHDPLTHLPNRALLRERIAAALAADEGPGLMLLGLDAFKEVNDSLGQVVGDALLQAAAVRLPLCTAQDALIARFSGDTFAVLLPAGADATAATTCAAAILEAFTAPFHLGEHTLHVRLSIGAAIAAAGMTDPDDLVADAGLALHQAKSDGRRCLRLYDPSMRRAVLARRVLHDELTRALEDGELVLHYQPQVSLGTGAVVGVEALLRWQHPQRGLLLPGAFLPALEVHPLADSAGRWIIEEACRQAAQWRAAKLPSLRVAVNLFGAQLRAGALVRDVTGALGRHRLEPHLFEVEVTETIALQADDAVLHPLRELHAHGVAIAFDDFGTGYASLSSLKRFPLTRLKIDRGFVRDVLTDQQDAGIIRAVLGLAESFGLSVIAEGIERPEQEVALRALGCHEGQGFLYGRAMTAVSLAALVGGTAEPRMTAA